VYAIPRMEDSYNIGVKEIDIQHRGLFDIISKLSATRRFETEGQYFLATLDKLVEYAKIHFSTEERYMREAQYPKLAEHQKEHRLFFPEVEKLMKILKTNNRTFNKKFSIFLKTGTCHIFWDQIAIIKKHSRIKDLHKSKEPQAMKTMEWQNDYTVGVKELDDQHRSLLKTINTLIEEQEDKYEAAKFSPALSSLIHYAYTHFATEERYLLQVHFRIWISM